MKKWTVVLALMLAVAAGALLLSGCGASTPKYTVTFDPNGGELVSGELTQTVEEGADAAPPEVSWGDKVLVWEGDYTNITADTTVTAAWKSWYDVTFSLNGGELVSGELTQRVLEGEDAKVPEVSNGHRELSWQGDWHNITADTVIEAEWTKVAMNTVDLAKYVQDRTVTVNVKDINGDEATGSGFFIDDHGTIVTNFHVVDGAAEITVEISGGGSFPVRRVVDFNHLCDMAILQIDRQDTPYLDFAEDPVRTGEQVYAVGSALGYLSDTFTDGIVSSVNRTYGEVNCIQMTTQISPGNSGGPLVNVYGEVVGINTASYTSGQGLNLAIKISELERLERDKNWTVAEFKEWYERETAVSWGVVSTVYDGYYYPSLVHTYQEVTGAKCIAGAMDDQDGWDAGYAIGYDCYAYAYSTVEYNAYTSYLKSNGFVYDGSEDFDAGTSYYYYNDKDGIVMDLFILKDNSEIWIWPYALY